MHATNQERSLYLCLLAALAGFLLGLALTGHTMAGPAGSRVHWPSSTEISR
jgi:hypothetical protein